MDCTNSKDEFEFNLDNIGTTGEILINDFVTKRQYRLTSIDQKHLLWWVNILCSSQCYSYYRKNDRIYLVVPVNEHLKYICVRNRMVKRPVAEAAGPHMRAVEQQSYSHSACHASSTSGGATFDVKPYIKHIREKRPTNQGGMVFDKSGRKEPVVFDKEYYDQLGNRYPHKVIEIECEPIYNDVMTCDIERITNIFELKSIIYSLISKL